MPSYNKRAQSPCETTLENIEISLLSKIFMNSPEGVRWSNDDIVPRAIRGKIAGSKNRVTGYRQIRCPKFVFKLINKPAIDSFTYAHRICVIIRDQQPIPPSFVINHLDFNKDNNTVGNLEVCTQAENMAYSR